MSFSFNFGGHEYDEGEVENTISSERAEAPAVPSYERMPVAQAAKRHTLSELIDSLPSRISYSSLDVRIEEPAEGSSTGILRLYRRDLFDARFQLIQEDDEASDDEASDAKQTSGPDGQAHDRTTIDADSDLVPGQYEGGLKTWECALDLVGVLSRHEQSRTLRGKRILELGCGTAIPSMYLLRRMLLGDEEAGSLDASMDLCDYNEQVLRLVTLPNLFLTWYFAIGEGAAETIEQAVAPATGEIDLTPELLAQFVEALSSRGITLSFFSGPWQGLIDAGAMSSGTRHTHDMILTSETIYSLDSLPALIDTLERAACGPSKPLESQVADMSITRVGDGAKAEASKASDAPGDVLCAPLTLVAAKVLYFGVGGGVLAFEQELKRRHRKHAPAQAKPVWKSERGVSRVVLQVDWSA